MKSGQVLKLSTCQLFSSSLFLFSFFVHTAHEVFLMIFIPLTGGSSTRNLQQCAHTGGLPWQHRGQELIQVGNHLEI